ncbi:transposase [Streptosporangium album]|uniref:Transposase n=1 Tax=Streptosporangium album TaxID=47479 RepID=A0A7W7S5K2_9ACTN|nr:ISL3 family transposase [Streptosporangium album]MBB4938419.1 transposase [Streptosporangium album]MBB4944001.1 transposase [Streptosporangium album]MBB4944298.1 transposase [Streptosporangium album]
MELERLVESTALVQILARTRAGAMPCPDCGFLSEKVHSRYQRHLADMAMGDRRMEIVLSVRRLICGNTACQRRTFAEQVAGLTIRYGRRTPLLRSMLEKIAVALAGRAGARLACGLRAIVSRSTMLRLVMALPDPVVTTPRVLGVDDFALRRGHIYGTVLIDCETGAPLDLLPGRDAQPLADWLAEHPGVEIICRDRSGSYADGARTGAPDAAQVADRFHLWQNLGKAVERCVARHRDCLRTPEPEPPEQIPISPPSDPPEAELTGRFAERARRHHALVHDLIEQGHGMRGIARRLGWSRHTVQRYARAVTWQELVDGKWKGVRPSKLDPFKPHLHQRWDAGCTNAKQLHREITALGFHGSYSTVRDYLDEHHARVESALIAAPSPTVRQVTGWLTRHPESLTEDDKTGLKPILEHCPELRAAAGHIRLFGEMLTELRGHNLQTWIAAVRADDLPGLTSFAGGLEADLDAVTNGLTTRWNSGPVEGRVNHIKMIKRQMFGRAGLPLLRKRVLLTAAR